MTVLDTFYLLFKSNADDVNKGLKEVEKQAKATEKGIKGATEDVTRLGQGFVKMVESGAAIGGAFIGFKILKEGLIDQANYNAGLKQMSVLTGISAQNLKIVAQLGAQAGGSRQGAIGNIAAINQSMINTVGYGIGNPIDWMKKIREQISGMSPNQKRLRLNKIGITDIGLQNELMGSDASFNKDVAQATNLAQVQAGGFAASLELKSDVAKFESAVGKMDSAIIRYFAPAIDTLIRFLTRIVNAASGHPLLGAAGYAGGAYLGSKALKFGAKKVLGIGAGEAAGTEGAGALALLGGPLDWIGMGIAGLGYADYKHLHDIYMKRKMGGHASLGVSLAQQRKDIGFWTARGYSTSDAAAIMANIYAESGGSATARGDNGKAYGLAQWHPDRAAAIKAGTGIDIYTASRQQQMEALAWEMHHRGGFNPAQFRGMTSTYAKAAYFSNKFESPSDFWGTKAAQRGNLAVSIDKIIVHTQATDADGMAKGVHKALSTHLSTLAANVSDGVSK